jgi:hypothetical protein
VNTEPLPGSLVTVSSGPLRYAIVDGMNVRDGRVHNYRPRWNAAPSQELLVIRRKSQDRRVSLDPLCWGSSRIGAVIWRALGKPRITSSRSVQGPPSQPAAHPKASGELCALCRPLDVDHEPRLGQLACLTGGAHKMIQACLPLLELSG